MVVVVVVELVVVAMVVEGVWGREMGEGGVGVCVAARECVAATERGGERATARAIQSASTCVRE